MKRLLSSVIERISNRIGSRIAVRLLIIFTACALVSIAFFDVSMMLVKRAVRDYAKRYENMLMDGYDLSLAMQNGDLGSGDMEKIDFIIRTVMEGKSYAVILSDMDGNLLYSSDGRSDKLPEIVMMQDPDEEMTVVSDMGLYAVKLNDTIIKLAVVPADGGGLIVSYYRNGVIPGFAAFVSILMFVVLFLLFTRRMIRYITELASSVKTISKGELGYRVGIRGNDELAMLAKELNNMADELGKYLEREKDREKLKSELMISISHDLKSPLTAVIGYLSLLKDGEYDGEETMSDYAERAYRKSLRIKSLLQELLDFASLSDEDITVDRWTISLDHMLEQLIAEYAGGFEQNGLRLATDFGRESVYADVDPEYMIRVFENLLSNSLRYSPKPGEIRMTLRKVDGSVIFAITNKSEEIGLEELDRLFDKFYRLDKSRSDETGGTGLGLAIARKITELHGGKLWAEYSDGEITFFVRLPASAENNVRVFDDVGDMCTCDPRSPGPCGIEASMSGPIS